MGAKRVLLIAGGTVGGLGVVLSITPPQFGTATASLSGKTMGGGTSTSSTPATPATPTPAQTQAATSSTPAPTTTKKSTTKATPAPVKTTAPAKAGATGTFVGDTSQTQFGPVQVQITVSNGKITNAKALQYPSRDYRSQSISSQAIPYLVQETIAASSANIQGVGGASYTSQGWYDSLVSALAKAGM